MHRPSIRLVASASLLALVAGACAKPAPRRPALDTRVQSLVKRAKAQERRRRYDLARSFYEQADRAARDDFNRAYAGRSYAMALIFWGEYDHAETELGRVVRLNPHDVASWHDLGMLRHRRGDVLGAEQAFRRAIALRKNNPRSRIALAALLWKTRRWADALHEYRALLDLALPHRVREKVQWAIAVLQKKLKSKL